MNWRYLIQEAKLLPYRQHLILSSPEILVWIKYKTMPVYFQLCLLLELCLVSIILSMTLVLLAAVPTSGVISCYS